MNIRQRYIETLTFGNPDRVPLFPGGARRSTLETWRKQGLPEGVDYIEYLFELIGVEIPKPKIEVITPGVDFRMIPQFEETIKYITMKLEENERGNISRLMKVKDMMIEEMRSKKDAKN